MRKNRSQTMLQPLPPANCLLMLQPPPLLSTHPMPQPLQPLSHCVLQRPLPSHPMAQPQPPLNLRVSQQPPPSHPIAQPQPTLSHHKLQLPPLPIRICPPTHQVSPIHPDTHPPQTPCSLVSKSGFSQVS